MIEKFDKKTYEKLRADYNAFVIHVSTNLGDISPLEIIQQLNLENTGVALLQSSVVGHEGRFSFLHYNSIYEFSVTAQDIATHKHASPLAELEKYQASQKIHFSNPLSRYTGGLIGYLSYDSVRMFEEIPDRHVDPNGDMPDVFFRAYKNTIGVDHENEKLVVSVLVDVKQNFEETLVAYEKALDEIEKTLSLLTPITAAPFNPESYSTSSASLDVSLDMDDDAFEHMVEKAKNHIVEGDVFQVVLSRKFEVSVTISPYELYRALNVISPSPYMFYMELPRACVVGASPEKLISLEGGVVQSSPLAGTRPRGTGISDMEMENDLLADPKERAEHMMLVDLARNDVGKISKAGSVNVKELMKAHYFSHVMHLSSIVEGEIKNELNAFDALEAGLPAGTLSGAPKVRAMEIIDQLEQSRRGIYGGSICAIDTEGNLNSCIVIRTAVVANGKATIRAGAGIVYDSDPNAEALETRHKARSILEAIKYAENASAVGRVAK